MVNEEVKVLFVADERYANLRILRKLDHSVEYLIGSDEVWEREEMDAYINNYAESFMPLGRDG
jgi:hypothetical protein